MGEQLSISPVEIPPVEVRVAATLGQLPTLRALAETVMLLADFTLDEVSDVRLAVDEVASILITGAAPRAVLRCEFVADDAGVRVTMSSVAAREGLTVQRGFGWHLLRTLTHSIDASQRPYNMAARGYPTIIEFSRARGPHNRG